MEAVLRFSTVLIESEDSGESLRLLGFGARRFVDLRAPQDDTGYDDMKNGYTEPTYESVMLMDEEVIMLWASELFGTHF